MLLAQVDPLTFAINITLIVGAVILGAVLLVVGMVATTAFRAWLFDRKQKKSEARYDDEFKTAKVAREREQNDPLVHRPR